MFSGSATDIGNRCESTALNYACDCFVPPDQFKIAEVHSHIFISFVTCWFKSSVVGERCVLSIFVGFFSPNCCNNRDAEVNLKITAVAPRHVCYLVMGMTCKIFGNSWFRSLFGFFHNILAGKVFGRRLYIEVLCWYLISFCQYWSANILPKGNTHGHRLP